MAEPKPPTGEELAAIRANVELEASPYARRLPTREVLRLLDEVERLRAAIRSHRDQRGDDRCWRDDEQLYAALPEGYTPPARDSAVELELCRKYIASRHDPRTEYVSPQRRIEELEAEVARLRREIADYDTAFGPFWTDSVRAVTAGERPPEAHAIRQEQVNRLTDELGRLRAAARKAYGHLDREYGNAVRNGCFPDLAPLLDELRAALGEGKG